MKSKPFRLGWLMAVIMLAVLACTCGQFGQAAEGIQTAQAVATQAQGLATQIEDTGALETVQAAATELATSGAIETLSAISTPVGDGDGDGVPDDIPIYPENAGVQVYAGVISYQANADLATTIAFYNTEMPANGWTKKDDLGQVFIFEKGDRTATFNLIDAQGSTVVGIQVQP